MLYSVLVCSDVLKCVAPLAVKRLICALLESDTKYGVAIMSSKYHAHLKYFKITDGVVLGIRKIVQVSNLQICI